MTEPTALKAVKVAHTNHHAKADFEVFDYPGDYELEFSGDDDASRSSFAESSEDAPALNRSYKTSFLSLKLPSFGATTVEGQLTPDSETLLASLGIEPTARAEELGVTDFCRIANALQRG
jgi:hypothetical protein